MTVINYQTIDQHLQKLNQFLEELEPTAKTFTSLKQYLLEENKNQRRTVERLLQLSAEAILAIVRMIVGLERLKKSDEVDEMIIELANFGIFPKSFAKQMAGFGGFRNVLVHGYVFIDNRKVFQNFQNRRQLRRFANYIAGYLKPRLV